MPMTHYDEINLTALTSKYVNGNREDVAAEISGSDNPAHTVLALLVRLLDEYHADPRVTAKSLMSLVEYRCISAHEDVIAELKAGDIDRALNMLGAG